MMTKLRAVIAFVLFLMCGAVAKAQISGIVTVPSGTYPNLAAVVTALNTVGVGAGGVTVNITAGNTQTAPPGGYQLGSTLLNATLSATNTITMNGNGNSITAPTGTGTMDGMFILKGVDYTTINALNLTESSANTTATTQMEWGYALLKLNAAAPVDGCQNNKINNCSITLTRANTASVGIYMNNHLATSTTALTLATAGDANSNNMLTANTIQNVTSGIILNGSSTATAYDQNNTALGNTIQNFAGSSTTAYGVYSLYQNNCVIYNNNISNNAGGGVVGAGTFYGIYSSTGTNSNVTIRKNVVNLSQGVVTSTFYGIQNAAGGATSTTNLDSNALTMTTTGSSAIMYCYYNTSTQLTLNFNGNTLTSTGNASTGTYYLFYIAGTVQATGTLNMRNNRLLSFGRTAASGTTYCFYTTFTGDATTTANIIGNSVNNVTIPSTSSASFYSFYDFGGTLPTKNMVNDSVTNVTMGTGTLYGIYTYNYGAGSQIANNYIGNLTSVGTIYGLYLSSTSIVGTACKNNIITGLTSTATASSMYGFYLSGSTSIDIFNNKISNLQLGITTSAALYGMYFSAGPANVYNNIVSDLRTPAGSSTSPIYGMFYSSGTNFSVYNNTVTLNPVSTGTNFGATGVYYASGITDFDFRNNIVRVNATPAGTGFVAALRRSAGTAGVVPANLNIASNGNIYYAPNVTNSFLYAEGTANPLINSFRLSNDPGFNSGCSLYKTFMAPRESASFTENNLTQIGTTNTYAPTGTSFAESGAVTTTTPAITLDFNGVVRSNPADIGALQFSGTANGDLVAPSIAYTPLPGVTYCTNGPVLTAAITDASGVNVVAATAPRIYFRKSTDANAFGVTNTSAGNGWKWVTATGTAPNFTFTIDYSLLQAPVAVGDSILYFVIAQDNAGTANVGAIKAGFTACPTSVNLLAANGPTLGSPYPNGYKILAVPSFTAAVSQTQLCLNGTVVLSVTPTPGGSGIQWQGDSGSGFVDITGATTNPYTATLSDTTTYRALIICNGGTVATSTSVVVNVANPVVLTTTPATRCGNGPVTLGATGTSLKWYDALTGSTSIGTGTSVTIPYITATDTFYVTASDGGGIANVGKTTPVSTSGNTGYSDVGLMFDAASAFTLQSVDVYALGSTTTGSITIALKNSAGTVLQTTTATISASAVPGQLNTIPLNFAVTPGTNYRLVAMAASGISSLIRESATTAFSYPYTLPGVVSITSAYTGGASSAYYYYFYNWSVVTGCESSRVPVIATVTPAPAITASSPQAPGVCTGTPVTVNVTSANTNYSYSWSTGQTTTTFTLTPTVSTNYVVTANDSTSGCVIKDSVTVNVNAQPTAPIITPSAATICQGTSTILTSTLFGGGNLLTEDFESGTLGAFTVSAGPLNTGLVAPSEWQNFTSPYNYPNSGVFNSGSKFVLTNSDAGGTSAAISTHSLLTTTGSYNTTGFTTLTLAFRHFYYYYPFGTPPDQGLVEVSTNGGTTWNTVQTFTSVQGALNAFAPATINLNAYVNVTALKIRFNYFSNWGYQWALDSVRLIGGPSVPSGNNNWTPVTGLYKDAAMLQPLVVGDTNRVVYASPATTTSYTAVANQQGCLSNVSNTATVTVNAAPPSAITYSGPTTFCAGNSLTLNAPTGAYSYQWNLNGAPIAGATGATYAATAAGDYTVKVTNSTPCSFTTATPVTITVNPLPPTTITPSGTLFFCPGGSVTLAAPTAPAGTTFTYVWKDNNVAVAGQTAPTFLVNSSRTVTVTVTNTTTSCVATTPTATVVNATTPPPAPITAAASTTICQGTTVRLRTNNAGGLTYQWSLGGTPITGATDSIYNAGAAGNYTVAVSAGTGCTTVSSALAVIVNALPPATIISSGAPTSFCIGGSVVLTANSGTGLTYQWQNSVGPVASTTSTYTASTTGNYSVIVTNSSTLCANFSNVIPVTVNALPTAAITPAAGASICAGASTTLSATTGTGNTYQWFNGGSPITGATSATYSANAGGAYTVLITNTNGCSATAAPVTVTVNPLPVPTVTPTGAVSICSGSSITLAGPSATGLTYQWKLGSANASGTSTGATYTATAAGSYTVVVTNASGCVATSAATVVSLLTLPTVTMIPAAATTACDSISLNTTSTGITYQWNFNGAPIVAATTNNYKARVSGNYSLTGTSTTNGCAVTTANVAMTVNQSPTATITPSSSPVFCEGGAVALNTNSSNNQTYAWRDSAVNIAGATAYSYITTTGGIYTVKVTNTATGCSRISDPLVVTVHPLPTPLVTYNSATNQLTTTMPFNLYQWYVNSQPITGATSRNYTPNQNGAYAVAVTDSNGCVNISAITFVNSLGINNPQAGMNVKVYPNPTTGVLHIAAPMNVKLVLRDITGKAVLSEDVQQSINLENLADGMYLLYISNAEGQLIKAEKITKHSY